MDTVCQDSQKFSEAGRRPAGGSTRQDLLGKIGPLEVRLAADPAELEAAQTLRYTVFATEMGATIRPARGHQRDEDRFDAVCDHLVVIDTSLAADPRSRIVGTYRLLRDEAARPVGGFYSQAEYDVHSIIRRHPERTFLELGRSCVLPTYRTKRTIELLWQGIWAYCLRHRIDVMIGCASFRGAVPVAHALPLSFLGHHAGACEAWNAEPVAADAVPLDMMPAEAIDTKAALAAMPPLIKGYLRLGAKVADHAVIDHAFRTTDVMIILPVEAISDRYVRHYGADASRFAPADSGQV